MSIPMYSPATQTNAKKLAVTLNKYDDTEIHVLGHTDNTGTDEYNMTLSKKELPWKIT